MGVPKIIIDYRFGVDGPPRQRRSYGFNDIRASYGLASSMFAQTGSIDGGSLPVSVHQFTGLLLHTDLYEVDLVGVPHSTVHLRIALEALISLLVPWRCPFSVDWNFDIDFSRYRREDGYVRRLYDQKSLQIVEEDRAGFNPRLFVLETPLLEATRGSHPYCDRSTTINRHVVMQFEYVMFERKIRLKNGALVQFHCQEMSVMSRSIIPDRNVLYTSWCSSVEETYVGWTEFPTCISYL